jgi:hypothetical protein
MRSLAKDPMKRFQSVVEFADALLELVSPHREVPEPSDLDPSIPDVRVGGVQQLGGAHVPVDESIQPGLRSPALPNVFEAIRSTLGFILLFLLAAAIVIAASRLLPR